MQKKYFIIAILFFSLNIIASDIKFIASPEIQKPPVSLDSYIIENYHPGQQQDNKIFNMRERITCFGDNIENKTKFYEKIHNKCYIVIVFENTFYKKTIMCDSCKPSFIFENKDVKYQISESLFYNMYKFFFRNLYTRKHNRFIHNECTDECLHFLSERIFAFTSEHKQSFFHLAALDNNNNFLKSCDKNLLEEYAQKINDYEITPLEYAIQKNNIFFIKEFLRLTDFNSVLKKINGIRQDSHDIIMNYIQENNLIEEIIQD